MTGDEAIMSALNSIIDKTPNGEQKKYKIGTAIILMLKRIKLRDLMMKQIKATELWKRYVRSRKRNKKYRCCNMCCRSIRLGYKKSFKE